MISIILFSTYAIMCDNKILKNHVLIVKIFYFQLPVTSQENITFIILKKIYVHTYMDNIDTISPTRRKKLKIGYFFRHYN